MKKKILFISFISISISYGNEKETYEEEIHRKILSLPDMELNYTLQPIIVGELSDRAKKMTLERSYSFKKQGSSYSIESFSKDQKNKIFTFSFHKETFYSAYHPTKTLRLASKISDLKVFFRDSTAHFPLTQEIYWSKSLEFKDNQDINNIKYTTKDNSRRVLLKIGEGNEALKSALIPSYLEILFESKNKEGNFVHNSIFSKKIKIVNYKRLIKNELGESSFVHQAMDFKKIIDKDFSPDLMLRNK